MSEIKYSEGDFVTNYFEREITRGLYTIKLNKTQEPLIPKDK